MNRDNMVVKKKKRSKLSAVPKKTEGTTSTKYALGSIRRSVNMAENADNHHKYAVHAQKDYNITNNWESLPIYHHGDQLPRMELFKNFKKTINNVL
ncbi:MAG: hypothetical protein GY852_11200 [bacterium]|nr:hypothetical protein [bacterium]